jgi:predicted regulator of Ras-like GTPase activity (Roadblock/LC7/MglB family)
VSTAFTEFLAELVGAVPMAIGAVIQDSDGETVDSFGHMSDFDLMVHAAQWGLLWRELQFPPEPRRLKGTTEILIETDRQKILLTTLFKEYYLVFILSKETQLTEARRILDQYLSAIREEMGL